MASVTDLQTLFHYVVKAEGLKKGATILHALVEEYIVAIKRDSDAFENALEESRARRVAGELHEVVGEMMKSVPNILRERTNRGRAKCTDQGK